MSKTLLKSSKGFTLIELLVVIAIIGILSSVVLASLSTARLKSRDARRVAGVGQLQLALEMYYDASSSYPTYSNLGAAQTWSTAAPVGGIIALTGSNLPRVPTDPGNNSYFYCPLSGKGATSCDGASYANAYALGVNLETNVTQNKALTSDTDVQVGSSPTRKFDGQSASCSDSSTSAAGTEQCYDIAS